MGFLYLLKCDDSELEIKITVPEDNFVILAAKDETKFFIAKWETDHYGWIAEQSDEPPDFTSSDLWAQLRNHFK